MNDVKRFLLPISIAIPALVAGIALGRYTASPAPSVAAVQRSNPSSTPVENIEQSSAQRSTKRSQSSAVTTTTEPAEPVVSSSSGDIIAQMRTALARTGNRRT